jgi:hypothetical protein
MRRTSLSEAVLEFVGARGGIVTIAEQVYLVG